jgi:hypothetical protein
VKYLLVIGLAACGFHGPNTGQPQDGHLDDSAPHVIHDTGPVVPGPDATIDGKISSPFCSADAHLRACFAFEGTTDDGSSYHSQVNATGPIAYDPGGQDGMAAKLDAPDTILLSAANASHVSVTAVAIRAYVKIPTLPTSTARMGIVDNDAYRMFVQANGTVRCAIGPNGAVADVTTGLGIAANTWTRIACLYDGISMTISLNYIPLGTQLRVGSIPMVTTQTAIGSNEPSGDNLVGLLDDVEIYDTTLVGP